jgi:pimeloyl-ACP methyl ester carboxylesterase
MTTKTVTAGVRQLSYCIDGTGPPMLLLNGLAGTADDWDPTFTAGLAAHNTVLRLDNRGVGRSPDDGAPFTIVDLASDCAHLLATELGGQPATVVGWSMGGFIAQRLTLDHPAVVARLVLLSTDPGGPGAEAGDRSVLAQLADLSPPPAEQARRVLRLLFPADFAERAYVEVGKIVADARARLAQDLLDRQLVAIDQWHNTADAKRLSQIAIPTLVATGSLDRVIPPANSMAIANGVRDSWLLRFRGGGHAFMAQYPNALATLITEFVAL